MTPGEVCYRAYAATLLGWPPEPEAWDLLYVDVRLAWENAAKAARVVGQPLRDDEETTG